MYVICTLPPLIFLHLLGVRPCPKLHKTGSSGLSIFTRIIFEIELFTTLNYFVDAIKTLKLTGQLFLFELLAVVSFVIVLSPAQQYLLENSLSTKLTTKVCMKVLCVTTTT